jgi:uncharacterized phiE125 gp8 family phage protein
MKRQIVTPAVLPPAALAELKHWLGISTAQDDAELAALLRAALEVCEAFTGLMPIAATCEEVLPVAPLWQTLSVRPIQAIVQVQGIPAEGPRITLVAEAYAVELDADGSGRVRVTQPTIAGRVAVRFTAGLAADWEGLPEPIRHGLLRLAAHQHRERDLPSASPLPPAAVAALWRRWRRLRVA